MLSSEGCSLPTFRGAPGAVRAPPLLPIIADPRKYRPDFASPDHGRGVPAHRGGAWAPAQVHRVVLMRAVLCPRAARSAPRSRSHWRHRYSGFSGEGDSMTLGRGGEAIIELTRRCGRGSP